MKTYKEGSQEWSELNEFVKKCSVCCGTSYIVNKSSIVELMVWAGGKAGSPLWFADEWFKTDKEYYEKAAYAFLKENTLFSLEFFGKGKEEDKRK